jgi:hypothetical protein
MAEVEKYIIWIQRTKKIFPILETKILCMAYLTLISEEKSYPKTDLRLLSFAEKTIYQTMK